jgi:glycerol-3-phosphate dehydrogenase
MKIVGMETMLDRAAPQGSFDMIVIGGGVNGAGIARDGQGRGLKVALFEQNDIASATSQWSTKLIHGGLRYLEHYKFRLVREALIEREVLLRIAPHIMWPLRFVLPHHKGLRPAWLLRLGLFLYDNLGGRKILPGTKTLDLRKDIAGEPLKDMFVKGFEYSDGWVQDARLVLLNCMDAAERGARISPRTRVVSAERVEGLWRVTVENKDSKVRETLTAKILINAAGPWVAQVFANVIRANAPAKVRLVQGSHLVVKKLYEHDRCYIFQNADGRIIFSIPYENAFTLIGTTDQDWKDEPGKVKISQEEKVYLVNAASEYFKKPVTLEDIVWDYSGVRPLYDDGASKAQEATRDYVLTLDDANGQPPLLSVFGGKITTYRRLSEAAFAKLAPHLNAEVMSKAGWSGKEALPGGDMAWDGAKPLAVDLRRKFPWLGEAQAVRLAKTYGTRVWKVFEGVTSQAEAGRDFGAGLTEAELIYLRDHEWAHDMQDALYRRTKLGLHMSEEQREGVAQFLQKTAAVV